MNVPDHIDAEVEESHEESETLEEISDQENTEGPGIAGRDDPKDVERHYTDQHLLPPTRN